MTQLERHIQTARRRITINRWFGRLCLTTMGAAAGFAIAVIAVRVFDLDWPLGATGLALLTASLIVSVIWATATRADAEYAAAALDEAAGLRERISSGYFCRDTSDPFGRAVVADAERSCSQVTARRYLRFTRPRHLPGTVASVLLATATLLLPKGWLVSADAHTADDDVQQSAVVIRERTRDIRRLAEQTPSLAELAAELDQATDVKSATLKRSVDLRRNALKTLDRMEDTLANQRDGDDPQRMDQFKKMLRGLKPFDDSESPVSKLSQSLSQGDFKSAREELDGMREQLSKLSDPADAERLAKIQNQLEQLAKRLETLADDKELQEQLAQAGLEKKDIERLLKNLTKKDVEQLKKQLEKQGLSQKSIDQLSQSLKKRCNACNMASKLGQSLAQAAKAMGSGANGASSGALGNAGDQLSEMEMLEQEMNQIDSMMADISQAKNDLANPCSACNGTGRIGGKPCSKCQGNRGGMGPNMRPGQGGIAPEAPAPAQFVKRRQKVPTQRGAIIGQFLVDGEQVKGSISPEVYDVVMTSERDATDAINRARIPRRYHKAVKGYFSDLQKSLPEASRPKDTAGDEKADDSESDADG